MATTASTKVPMDRTRKIALVAGVMYLATFVTSIPALGLYHTALNDPGFLSGNGSESSVQLGAFLEMLCAITGIGTAIVLYPVVRRVDRIRAVGFIASRTLEASMIFVGVVSVLSLVTMRQSVAGGDASALTGSWHAVVALHDWTFTMGPGYMPAFNALCLAVVMRRSGLVPRIIPTLGLIGAPVLFFSTTVTLFGGWESTSAIAPFFALPIAAWEFSVGAYMAFKGFRPSPVLDEVDAHDEVPELVGV
jgi:hypothetical protein